MRLLQWRLPTYLRVLQNGAFEVTITFSEAVVNFEAGDIAFSDDNVDANVTETDHS